MRIIVGRVARRYGCGSACLRTLRRQRRIRCAPHFSLKRGERRYSPAGTAPRMTPAGEFAVAGVLAGLPDAQGVLCG